MSPGGEPLQEGTVIVEFLSPSGRTDRVRLLPGGEENWGLFTGTFVVPEAGEYRLRLTSAEQEETLETVLVVSGDVLEKTGQPARPAVLEAIARLTRGRLVTPDEFGAVIEAVRALPDPPPVEHRVRIWAHWAWMLLLVTLLSAFWIGRKWAGAV
jgi:hypothetical protein